MATAAGEERSDQEAATPGAGCQADTTDICAVGALIGRQWSVGRCRISDAVMKDLTAAKGRRAMTKGRTAIGSLAADREAGTACENVFVVGGMEGGRTCGSCFTVWVLAS